MQPLLQSSSLDRKLTPPQTNGNPELSFVRREMEATRHDTDHREGRSIQMDDAAAFGLYNYGETIGLFQMESGGMTRLSKQFEVEKLDDIIA